ncbi:MAG: cytosine permease [Albidovulum sp.]
MQDNDKKGASPHRDDQSAAHAHTLAEGIESVLSVTDEDIADYTESVVPLEKRRSNFRMLAQFLSMQAVFGTVLVGYGARFQGLSLGELMVAMVIASVIMSIYCIGSANAGAVTGQTHSVMARSIFGTLGSGIVSVLLVINGMAFYLFTVKFLVDIIGGLVPLPAVALITAVVAFVMIFNTYFGFEGVQRFAQYVAVPVIILWGVYALILAFTTVDSATLATIPPVESKSTMLMVITGIVGLNTWGNEPDFFRYAKSGRAAVWNIPTIVISYVVGTLLFPILGYLIAALANQPEFGASIAYFVNFTMFGSAFVGIVIIAINQWAVQDGNLYIAVNGAQNLLSNIPGWKRQYTVIGLGLIAAIGTFFLGNLEDTFVLATSIGSTTVPVASVIMAMDIFVLPRLFGINRPMHRVASWGELSFANWPAVIALVAGTFAGAYWAGLTPFNSEFIGFPALQAWVVGGVLYLVGVAIVSRSADISRVLGFARI